MAFSKDDKDYLKLMIKPLVDGIALLNKQMTAHDDETKTINDEQQRMIGAWNIVKYAILPVVTGIIGGVGVWIFTR